MLPPHALSCAMGRSSVCVSEIGLAPMMRCPWTRARNTHQRDARMWNTHAACICCRAGFPTELVDLTASIEEYGNVSGIYAALHRGDVDIYPEARRTPRRRQRAAEGRLTLLVSTLSGLLRPIYPAGVEVGGGGLLPSIRFRHEENSGARTSPRGIFSCAPIGRRSPFGARHSCCMSMRRSNARAHWE